MSKPAGTAGFSLVELLAAMAIFAVLAVMAQQVLVVALTTQTRIEVRRSDIGELQRVVALIGRDLENIAPRGIRSTDGESEPLLSLGGGGRFFTFTRGGLPNPAALPRSGFHRIRYAPGDGGRGIERRVWRRPYLDSDQGSEVKVLLQDVEEARFRVWNSRFGWTSIWPDPENAETRDRLPEGVEAVLETRIFGTIRRVSMATENCTLLAIENCTVSRRASVQV